MRTFYRNFIVTLILSITSTLAVTAQVKIGTNPQTIDASSVLELESTTGAFVIPRMTTLQMEAISPIEGAMIYNTEEECLHYFDSNGVWINICEAFGSKLTFTSDAVSNPNNSNTISITQDPDDENIYNFEVSTINGSNIQPSVVAAIHIANDAITNSKLADGAVRGVKIADEAITPRKIEPGGASTVLQTTAGGLVSWAPLDVTTVSGRPLNSDGSISVTGAETDVALLREVTLSVAVDGITTSKILDANVTEAKLDKANIPLSGFAPAAADVDLGTTSKLINVADPINNQDAATKAYVDAAVGSTNTLTDGTILVGDIGDVAQQVLVSGDATLDNAGVLTIADDAINTDKILDGAISTNDIADNTITPEKLAAGTDDNQILRYNNTSLAWELIDQGSVAITETDGVIGNEVTGVTPGNTTLTLSGTETTTDPLTLAVSTAGITDNELADNAVTNTKIADDAVTLDKIADAPANVGSFLAVGPSGAPTWLSATDFVDDDTVEINALLQLQVKDEGITPAKIEPSTNDGEVLTTVGGATAWTALPTDANTEYTAGEALTLTGTVFSIEDGDVSTDKIADNAITSAKIADANVTEVKIAPSGTDGQVLTTVAGATAWTALPTDANTEYTAGEALTLTGTVFSIEDGDVSTDKIADNAITSAKIADANVTEVKIAPSGTDGQVLTTVAGATAWTALPTDANTEYTAGEALTLTGTVFSIEDGDVSTDKIADNAITSDKIADANVTEVKIAPSGTDGQVLTTVAGATAWTALPTDANTEYTAGEALTLTGTVFSIEDGDVSTDKIADNAITSAKIADANVTEVKIAPSGTDGQVLTTVAGATAWTALPTDANTEYTAGEALTLTGTVFSIEDGDVSTDKIADNAITSDKIADGTIVNGDVNVSAAIAGSKIVPTFDANVSTTGTLTIGAFTITNNIGNADQVLTTDGSGNATWKDFATENLSNTNLTQTSGENRTYDLNGFDLVYNGTGNIGIGALFNTTTNLPSNKLHVAGAIRSQGILNSDGNAGEPSYRFSNDTNSDSGFYFPYQNQIGVSTGGTEAIRIGNNQNIGIGDFTATGNTNPNSTLQVKGSFSTAIIKTTGDLTLTAAHHTIIIDGNHNITLPAANGATGRIYIIKTPTTATATITTYINSFGEDSSSATTSPLPAGITQLQSDGTAWQQIN
ncbi:hypothetical protein H0I23_01170 [Cellulophaga sp. HaHaR_3_176]|uniref:beta strand repeat-containing protein n=1 Tax=Cellulophaga sp. HaHaR_3_176 TaxID=1942464 RepID=UPI001C1F587F|nr:hypothetical protein [Cellulophaga sp. HaHaR_3_176]QWX84293.1 hypothetical protein H0I23_01170 [Cellulophaga sp. HaHaR_3_176]